MKERAGPVTDKSGQRGAVFTDRGPLNPRSNPYTLDFCEKLKRHIPLLNEKVIR